MSYDLDQIKLIPAEKENFYHKKGLWNIYKENLEFNIINRDSLPYENHCKWWETAFENEYIYIILYQSLVCGYIRLTKQKISSKEKNVISISLAKKFQHGGIGTYAYNLFEKLAKNNGVNQIIALTVLSNKVGQKFFKANGFILNNIDEVNNYERYIKTL